MLCPRYGRPQGAEDAPCGSQAADVNPGGPDLSHPGQLICVPPSPPRTLQLKPQGIKISKLYTVLEH